MAWINEQEIWSGYIQDRTAISGKRTSKSAASEFGFQPESAIAKDFVDKLKQRRLQRETAETPSAPTRLHPAFR
jgi:hypothetical protein